METEGFIVKIRNFEGPLDLILSLIEERKLLVSDVSITQVTDDFLTYLQTRETLPLREAANFILVAATLLLLKSRSLLPMLSLSSEEDDNIRDLEWRLKIYQSFRTVAKRFAALTARMFFGGGARVTEPIFSPSPDLSLDALREAAARAINNAPEVRLAPEVSVAKVVSLEEMIKRLAERIEKAVTLTFRDFAGGSGGDRRELVVGFLAMLELVKRGMLLVTQESSFGDIRMNYHGDIKAPRFD